jgi:hypothetical protein
VTLYLVTVLFARAMAACSAVESGSTDREHMRRTCKRPEMDFAGASTAAGGAYGGIDSRRASLAV